MLNSVNQARHGEIAPIRMGRPRATTTAVTPSDRWILGSLKRTRWEHEGHCYDRVGLPNQTVLSMGIARAFHANYIAGSLTFREESGSHLFGLWRYRRLYAESTGRGAAWPVGSLEAWAAGVAGIVPTVRVSDRVYDWVGADSFDPWATVAEMVLSSLARRGLLTVVSVQRRLLRVFRWTSECYLLNPAHASARGETAALPVGDEISNQLLWEIRNGVNRRTVRTG